MKKLFAILAATALLALGTAAFAADTATITVTATVQGTCAFQSTAATMAFGILPVPAADTTADTALGVACSNGTIWTITPATGAFSLAGNPAGTLPGSYQVLTTTGTGTGPLNFAPVTVRGTILAADYGVAPAGVYTGSFQVSVNP